MSNWQPPRFDLHQFDRKYRAISTKSRIAFSDYKYMHSERRNVERGRRLDTPSWATKDKELREVVLRYYERRFYLRHRGTLNAPVILTNEQRLAAIREKELAWAERCKSNLRSLIERQKVERSDKLAIQIQNIDSQILMARRGGAAIATAIVYLYFRCGYASTEVAQELGIRPPLVRQTLARLHNAAEGKIYCSPKYQRIKEARREMKRVRDLFIKLKRIIDATERQAAKKELEKIATVIPKPQRRKPSPWTLDRLRFIYFQRLRGRSWDSIAYQLGFQHSASMRRGFNHFMVNMNLLPDFKQRAA
jgi:AraC-like DNA-binding protein